VDSGDEVLWYFANFGADINTGDELDLLAPARARPGRVEVRVVQYTFDGKRSPADDGTIVRGGRAPVATVDGRATVVVEPGREVLRAVHRPDISSARTPICVSAQLAGCPKARGRRIVGTARADSIADTAGADTIAARAGADRINVRGGGADRVNCGPGRDRVVLSGNDAARRCEVQIRR
jgi:Ca2+-binding RTX toxin-like protein